MTFNFNISFSCTESFYFPHGCLSGPFHHKGYIFNDCTVFSHFAPFHLWPPMTASIASDADKVVESGWVFILAAICTTDSMIKLSEKFSQKMANMQRMWLKNFGGGESLEALKLIWLWPTYSSSSAVPFPLFRSIMSSHFSLLSALPFCHMICTSVPIYLQKQTNTFFPILPLHSIPSSHFCPSLPSPLPAVTLP